jgi:hypothetical protein
MPKKTYHQPGNPDFRRHHSVPGPTNRAIEGRLFELLSPGTFASLKTVSNKGRQLRERTLTLPVMAAIVLSLVYRQMTGLSEVLRTLEQEGLFWVKAQRISKQALSQRLQSLPAHLFASLLEQVIERLNQSSASGEVSPFWRPVRSKFSAIWLADGSTLEALKKKMHCHRGKKAASPLGGKMMMMVDAFNHRPQGAWYSPKAQSNDKLWTDSLLERLPQGGLMVFDLGFFKFSWFDAFSEAGKFFVTRLREKTAYKTVEVLGQNRYVRDELVTLGQYRSNPCHHTLRLVSVSWDGTIYRYLTNVTDPKVLSAQYVSELYRQRWRIEEAFLLTKRLLGLAYLWVGGSNGIEIQIYATWLFHAVLTEVCSQVSEALHEPIDRISQEMVFRSLYFFSRAQEQGRVDEDELIPFLVQYAKSFGLVKARRKRRRKKDEISHQVWSHALT